MHYNNVFLVKAGDRIDALGMVKHFLKPYDENLIDWDEISDDDEHMGEWDWYQFGGRWMWSDLEEKYMHNIVKPGTNHYWNRFHDEEVKGKKWLCVFPDGTRTWLDYGANYELKDWVDKNPESEVKNAADLKFYEIIESQLEARRNSIERDKKQITKYESDKDDDFNMLEYYRKKVENKSKRWTVDSYFWNITENSYSYNGEEIEREPESWFLVNMDLHT